MVEVLGREEYLLDPRYVSGDLFVSPRSLGPDLQID